MTFSGKVQRMPRIKPFISYEQQAWERELRARYGGMLTRRQIGIELGHRNNMRWQAAFVADLRSYGDGVRRYYKVADVAAKICATM